MTKTCARCKEQKPITEFRWAVRGKYRGSYCGDCERAYAREWSKTETGRASRRAKEQRAYVKDPSRRKVAAKKFRDKRNDQIFEIYGRACSCCGEAERVFLTIDHVNNDGGIERKFHGGNEQFRNWLVKQARLPQYQTLCWNCQWGRRINGGICPHELVKAEVG